MKKIITCLILIAAVAAAFAANTACAEEEQKLVTAFSAYLTDSKSGRVLYAKDENEKHEIASMVKIMTATLTFEALERGELSLEEEIVVSHEAAGMGGSQMFLDAGESYKAGDLLKGVVIASANDASVALAERISGSHEAFVNKMNARARELGMNNTRFCCATGLPDSGEQYSTAKDVNVMTRELMKHKAYYDYAGIWLEDVVHPSGRTTQLVNTNKLIRNYSGCVGGKTGFTDEAGFCLSACAERKGVPHSGLIDHLIPDLKTEKFILDITQIYHHLVTYGKLPLLLIIQDPEDQQDHRFHQLQIHPVIILGIGKLYNSLLLINLQPVPKNRQIFLKFFPVLQYKIIICPPRLISFAQKTMAQELIADPLKFISVPLQHFLQ